MGTSISFQIRIFLNLLGISAIVFAIVKTGFSDKLISVILAFFWLCNELLHHIPHLHEGNIHVDPDDQIGETKHVHSQ